METAESTTPDIYKEIAQYYPDRILAIYLRNIKHKKKISPVKALYKEPVVHFDKILSIRVNLTIEMSEICIENENFSI